MATVLVSEPHVELTTHYNVGKKELLVTVEKAFINNPTEANPDPFVSLALDTQKFTTKTKRNTNNPVWGEKFVFDVLQFDERPCELQVALWDSDIIGKDHLGSVTVPVQELVKLLNTKLLVILPPGGIVEPEQADYISFDRSGLTDEAIKLVQQHVAKKHELATLKAEVIAKDMRDFLGQESPESPQIAATVLEVWRRKNSARFDIIPLSSEATLCTGSSASVAAAQKGSGAVVVKSPQKPSGQFLADFAPVLRQSNVAGVPITNNELHRLFDHFDVDHNGVIKKEELERFCLSLDNMGVVDEPKNVRKLIDQFDKHGDGLSFDEFAIVMLRLAQR